MRYVILGRTGAHVSRISLGTAFRGQLDDSACASVVHRALDLGINFIDTANVYGEGRVGQAETVIGKVLKGRRADAVIATKIFHPVGPGVNDRGASRIHLLREIDNCLTRLDTDHVDFVYIHEPDSDTPLESSLAAAEAIVRSGKARHVGLSRHSAWQAARALGIAQQRGFEPIALLQARYNLIYREAEIEILPFIRDSGLGLSICSPLAIGLLSGQFRSDAPPPPGTPWASGYVGFEDLMTAQTDRTVSALRRVASRIGKTPAQVAIAWLLSHHEVSTVIIGPDNLEQLEEDIMADFDLTPEDRALLDEVSAPAWARRP